MNADSRAAAGAARFGVFEADLDACELRKQGVRIRLQDQPFQVLRILLERAGEVVTRDELRQRIWPADTFVDFDHGLNNAVKRLREALGESADVPRYVETVPRRGYRFIATVEMIRPSGNGTEPLKNCAPASAPVLSSSAFPMGLAATLQVSRKRPTLQTWRLAVVAALVLFLALLIALDVARVREQLLKAVGAGRESPQRIQSIAVLPLTNLSGDPAQEYFADGMTEELITDLSQIAALKVISRTSVMRFKKTDKSMPEIARELGADALVEGTVMRSGGRVRITAQLINGTTDKHLWGASFERRAEDVMALQREVARSIAEQIQVTLTPRESGILASARPVSPEAHDAYLAGRFYLSRSIDQELRKGREKSSEEAFQRAVGYFKEAVRDDPGYARAHLGFYEALSSPQVPHLDLLPRAKVEVEKALALDETLVEAHLAKALLLTQYEHDWSWSSAGKEFQRAVELNSNSASAHGGYSDYLLEMGRRDEGQKERGLERQLESDDPTAPNFGSEDQVEQMRDYLDKTKSTDAGWHWYLAKCLEASGRKDDAIREWERTMALSGFPVLADALTDGFANGDFKTALREWVGGLEEEARHRYIPRIVLAMVYVDLGDRDHAFAWLDRAYEERNFLTAYLKQEQAWDPIRSDPRFKDLVRRVGLPP
ncbi:MAG TPA: winged helix-turn-helix domain-containing protein [Terriglobia bacterium]|nr:winged helix-turn-helix domain-containing protein [Terriglobia bacterium]